MKSGGRTGSWRIILASPCETFCAMSSAGRASRTNAATGDSSSVLLRIQHLSQVAYNGIRAVLEQGVGVSLAVDAEHESEVPRPARLHPRDRVFDDDGPRGRNAEVLR